MSFYAHSAEHVYEYALRAGRQNLSLMDRFGLSIVFVNDSSEICRRFLAEHFVDLSYRTAERIRFIFFAEMDEQAFERIASSAAQAARGLVGSLMSLFSGQEATPREPSPAGLVPVQRPEDTLQKLGRARDATSAVSGVGAALSFAQKLGIGGDVPCLVVFTDIGALTIDVMPISGMRIEDIYRHVRSWIDDFYKANRQTIERWSKAEKEIQKLSSARLSPDAVKQWRGQTETMWKTLRNYARVIQRLEESKGDSASWTAAIGEFAADSRMEGALHDELVKFRRAIERIRNVQALSKDLQEAAGRLEKARDFRTIYGAFQSLDIVTQAVPELQSARQEIQSLGARYLPAISLASWWATGKKKPMGFDAWSNFRGDSARLGDVRDECDEINRLIKRLRINANLEGNASSVALQIGRPRAKPAIQSALEDLFAPAPEWLRSTGSPLTIGEVAISLDFASGLRKIDRDPRLRELVETAERKVFDSAGFRSAETTALQLKERAMAEVAAAAERCAVTPLDWQTAAAGMLERLRLQRAAVERSLRDSAEWAPQRDLAEIVRLHGMLDEFESVMASLVYPHRGDPLLKRVELSGPAAGVLGVAPPPSSRETALLLAKKLQDAAADASSAIERHAQERPDVQQMLPGIRLARALEACLPAPRVTELYAPAKMNSAGSEDLYTVLDALTEGELSCISARVTEGYAPAVARLAGKDTTIERILTTAGADTRKLWQNRDPQPIRPEFLYDVFLAHRGEDDDSITGLAAVLEGKGLTVWVDHLRLPPGRTFPAEIQKAMEASRAIAICFGQGGVTWWQSREMNAALLEAHKRAASLIPIRLPGAPSEYSLPSLVMQDGCVTYSPGDQEALDKIYWGITGIRPEPELAA